MKKSTLEQRSQNSIDNPKNKMEFIHEKLQMFYKFQIKEEELINILKDNNLIILKEAQEDNTLAHLFLGRMYYHGINFPKNQKDALDHYLNAAKKQNSDAMVDLGLIYEDKERTNYDQKNDAKTAFENYQNASKLKNFRSFYYLGRCYQFGNGCQKNEKEAFELYTKSAKMGYADAKLNIGECYENGIGCSKKEKKAYQLYMESAQLGNAKAMCNLGWCYQNGVGCSIDERKAMEFYSKSSENGYSEGICKLGEYAVEFYIKLARSENSQVICNLGKCFETGKECLTDRMKAIELYIMAADTIFNLALKMKIRHWNYIQGQQK